MLTLLLHKLGLCKPCQMFHPKSQRIDVPKKHRMMLHKPYF
jgi:hypothetical protein